MSASYRLPSARSKAVMSQWRRDSAKDQPVESPEAFEARMEAMKQRVREADAKAGRKPWKAVR